MADLRRLAGPFGVLVFVTACRSEPPPAQPRWLRGQSVVSLGDGQCAVLKDGKLRCESAGDVAATNIDEPVRALASSEHLQWTARCALLDDGSVACWGCCPSSHCWPLGDFGSRNILDPRPPPPVEGLHVLPLRDARQITLSTAGACAVVGAGEVWCWGQGFWGRRPDGNNLGICRAEGGEAPRRLAGFPRTERIALSLDGRLCGVTPGGAVYCQAQSYSAEERLLDPRGMELDEEGLHRISVPPASDVVGGEKHFCALARDGSVSCWGDNTYEQSGAPRSSCIVQNEYLCRVKPNRVALSAPAAAVSAGSKHSCALLEDGSVSCWGKNESGALGFGSNERCDPCFKGFCDRIPGKASGIDNIVEIHASRFGLRTFALTDDGQVVTWPELGFVGVDGRPECPCDEREPAITSAEALRRAREVEGRKVVDLLTDKVRVRGRVSTVVLRGQKYSVLGELVIEPPRRILPVNEEEVVVTGVIRRLRVAPDGREVWSLQTLHVCRVFPK